MELIGHVKNYDWGQLGKKSLVAQLMIANSQSPIEINENLPYAELWMGDHPSGTSLIKSNVKPLDSVLSEQFPFLFKVLSISKPLSIQVHPSKEQAKNLHMTEPDKYPDDNYKPEMAIALTRFQALCGFRPCSEILQFCHELPPLNQLLGGNEVVKNLISGQPHVLREIYSKLFNANEQEISSTIEKIWKNYTNVLDKYKIREVFNIIMNAFPNDVGLLSLFFLNILELKPGDCLYLAPNEIHSYLSGDCVECMARSDNVIRAGITPKHKDIPQLLKCLNFKCEPANGKLLQPQRLDANSLLFVPPVPEFAIIEIKLSVENVTPYKLKLPPYVGILIVIEGTRCLILSNNNILQLKRGSIVYLSPELIQELQFTNSEKSDNFIGYLATKNNYRIKEQSKQLK